VVSPLVTRQLIVPEVVGTCKHVVGVITQHVQVCSHLTTMLASPAVNYDFCTICGQVTQQLISSEAGFGSELEGTLKVTRRTGSACTKILVFGEVIDDEIVFQTFGDHV